MRRLYLKIASHAHDRMVERTPFAPGRVEELQAQVDALALDPGEYHLPLRHPDGWVAGYAQFKSVPNRSGPVLATVLGPEMRPSGYSLEDRLRAS